MPFELKITVTQHTTRTIEAWKAGKRRLFCGSCHRTWLDSQPLRVAGRPYGRTGCARVLIVGALLTAVAIFIAANATAAENLTPCDHFGDEYYGVVEARIRQAAPGETLWQATVYPPPNQGGEWGIRATRVGDDYELTVVRLDRSVWGTGWAKTGHNEFKRDLASSPARPRATTHKISARLFTALESALRRSIEGARAPDEASLGDVLNLHGVLFRFEIAGSGCGETRPLDWGETQAGRLAAIVLALCNPSDENRILRMLDELQHAR